MIQGCRCIVSITRLHLRVRMWTQAYFLWSLYIVVWSLGSVRLCDPINCSTPGFPVLHHLSEFAQTHVHWFADTIQPNHLILCCSLLLLPSVFCSIRVFSSEFALCIRWPKYWSFSISPSNEDSGLISFRMDWFDLLAVQGTDSQVSSLTPQFKSISSSALSLLYGPCHTSRQDYQKNHSFEYTDLCWQRNVSAL